MTALQQITKRKDFKKTTIILFLTISAIIWLGMLVYGHYYISTDDAYINANIAQIAPRITGKITKVYVINNQHVKQGERLFDLDPEPFQLAVAAANAELQLSLAELDHATLTKDRTLVLVTKHYLSPQTGDDTIANFKTAQAKVEQAKSHLAEANLNLNYTQVVAPVSGFIANLNLYEGSIVSANQPLFALIDDNQFWVDTNFKETELKALQIGQRAKIVSDMYPNHPFQGVVESISDGAGSAFSLLPPQNATGNWVKVTQRVPVRVRIINLDPHFPLRIGTSAEVTIHLTDFSSISQTS